MFQLLLLIAFQKEKMVKRTSDNGGPVVSDVTKLSTFVLHTLPSLAPDQGSLCLLPCPENNHASLSQNYGLEMLAENTLTGPAWIYCLLWTSHIPTETQWIYCLPLDQPHAYRNAVDLLFTSGPVTYLQKYNVLASVIRNQVETHRSPSRYQRWWERGWCLLRKYSPMPSVFSGLLYQNATDWLPQQQILRLTGLGARSSWSRCWQTPYLLRASFPMFTFSSSHCVLTWFRAETGIKLSGFP